MKSRIFGLDIIRAGAIILVLLGHLGHVGLLDNTYPMFLFGYYGVELFFVLSGFLIGQILIRDLLQNGVTIRAIRNFWMNRWMRTLPLYYLVLIIRLIAEGQGNHLLHFVFLQNFQVINNYDSTWFGESWSLAIEEYFYLMFPVLLFLAGKIFKQLNAQMLSILFMVFFVCLSLRVMNILNNPKLDYENDIRKLTYVRLDSLAVGVFVAYLKIHFENIFKHLQKWFIPVSALVVLFLLLAYGNILVYDFKGTKLIPSSVGIIFNSILLGLLLPYFDQITSRPNQSFLISKLSFSFIHYTAIFSYCLYLIHLPIYHLIIRSKSIDPTWILQTLITLVILYAIAWLSYNYFERPILELRKKLS